MTTGQALSLPKETNTTTMLLMSAPFQLYILTPDVSRLEI